MQFYNMALGDMKRRDRLEKWERIIELETRLSALEKYLGVKYQNHSEYVKVKEDK